MEYQFHNHLDGGTAVNLEASQNGLSSTKLISSIPFDNIGKTTVLCLHSSFLAFQIFYGKA